MGIYFDKRGEIRDSAVLSKQAVNAFNEFMNEPSWLKLRIFESRLNDLRDYKIPFDYTELRAEMFRKVAADAHPCDKNHMAAWIAEMQLVNKENPFSYSHSSASLVTNSDLERIKKMYEDDRRWGFFIDRNYFINGTFIPRIKKIIVNDQTTIVMWWDETKTIVRPTANDKFDLDAAVCAAIAKKLYGTNSALKKDIRKKVVYQENKKKKEEG